MFRLGMDGKFNGTGSVDEGHGGANRRGSTGSMDSVFSDSSSRAAAVGGHGVSSPVLFNADSDFNPNFAAIGMDGSGDEADDRKSSKTQMSVRTSRTLAQTVREKAIGIGGKANSILDPRAEATIRTQFGIPKSIDIPPDMAEQIDAIFNCKSKSDALSEVREKFETQLAALAYKAIQDRITEINEKASNRNRVYRLMAELGELDSDDTPVSWEEVHRKMMIVCGEKSGIIQGEEEKPGGKDSHLGYRVKRASDMMVELHDLVFTKIKTREKDVNRFALLWLLQTLQPVLRSFQSVEQLVTFLRSERSDLDQFVWELEAKIAKPAKTLGNNRKDDVPTDSNTNNAPGNSMNSLHTNNNISARVSMLEEKKPIKIAKRRTITEFIAQKLMEIREAEDCEERWRDMNEKVTRQEGTKVGLCMIPLMTLFKQEAISTEAAKVGNVITLAWQHSCGDEAEKRLMAFETKQKQLNLEPAVDTRRRAIRFEDHLLQLLQPLVDRELDLVAFLRSAQVMTRYLQWEGFKVNHLYSLWGTLQRMKTNFPRQIALHALRSVLNSGIRELDLLSMSTAQVKSFSTACDLMPEDKVNLRGLLTVHVATPAAERGQPGLENDRTALEPQRQVQKDNKTEKEEAKENEKKETKESAGDPNPMANPFSTIHLSQDQLRDFYASAERPAISSGGLNGKRSLEFRSPRNDGADSPPVKYQRKTFPEDNHNVEVRRLIGPSRILCGLPVPDKWKTHHCQQGWLEDLQKTIQEGEQKFQLQQNVDAPLTLHSERKASDLERFTLFDINEEEEAGKENSAAGNQEGSDGKSGIDEMMDDLDEAETFYRTKNLAELMYECFGDYLGKDSSAWKDLGILAGVQIRIMPKLETLYAAVYASRMPKLKRPTCLPLPLLLLKSLCLAATAVVDLSRCELPEASPAYGEVGQCRVSTSFVVSYSALKKTGAEIEKLCGGVPMLASVLLQYAEHLEFVENRMEWIAEYVCPDFNVRVTTIENMISNKQKTVRECAEAYDSLMKDPLKHVRVLKESVFREVERQLNEKKVLARYEKNLENSEDSA